MPDNFMERITFFITFFLISFSLLLLLLGLLYVLRLFLQRAARKNAVRTSLDLIGRRAVVVRTVRGRRPGRIRFEQNGRQIEGDAFSDDLVRRGQAVRITAINQGCFRIRAIENGEPSPEKISTEKSILENIVNLDVIPEERSDS